jgi:hypothetical protein
MHSETHVRIYLDKQSIDVLRTRREVCITRFLSSLLEGMYVYMYNYACMISCIGLKLRP